MFFYFSFIFWLLAYSTHQAVQPLGSTALRPPSAPPYIESYLQNENRE